MTGLAGKRWLAPVLLGLVIAIDHVLARMSFDVIRTGFLDETAHLATAALVLLAVGHTRGGLDRAFVVVVLVSACAIDVDHVPSYVDLGGLGATSGRPVTHSLLLPLVLAAVAAAAPARWRRALLAAALGVALHLFRDVASAPGIPGLWPLVSQDVRLPYSVYLGTLAVVTFVATPRQLSSPS